MLGSVGPQTVQLVQGSRLCPILSILFFKKQTKHAFVCDHCISPGLTTIPSACEKLDELNTIIIKNGLSSYWCRIT